MGRYVFVSHANEDKPKLKVLIEVLLDAGIELWIDRPEELGLGERLLDGGRIKSGVDWQQEIRRGLEHAGCVLFVLSRASNSSTRSDELFREFEYGKISKKLVVAQIEPIDRAELNPFFRIRQAIDLTKPISGISSQAAMQARQEVLVERLREFSMIDGSENQPQCDPDITKWHASAGQIGDANSVRRPPRLLPYLTNRYEQQRHFTRVLQAELDRGNSRPITFVATGSTDDCVDSFAEQVRYMRLPAILKSNGFAPDVLYRRLQWPIHDAHVGLPSDNNLGYLLEDVKSQLYDTLAVRSTADFEKKLADTSVSCLFHVGFGLADWQGLQRGLMLLWLQWLSQLDLSLARHPIITLISVEYPSGFFRRLWYRRALNRIRLDFRANSSEFGAAVYALPELRTVRFADVEQWIREYVENVDREVLRRLLRQHFVRKLGWGERRLSMYEAAEAVKSALVNPTVRIGTS